MKERLTAASAPAGLPPVDLNADLGEGFGRWQLTDDEALLSAVTSANVACGFHAGDAVTMRRVCDLAAERGVRIGAQISYRDLAGFGRRAMDVPPDVLAAETAYQIGGLAVFARAAGLRVSYVRPHGALYHRVLDDEEQAAAVVAGIQLTGERLPVLTMPGSRLAARAVAAGLPAVTEAFADRAYTAAGRLVPRGSEGAVVQDPETVLQRAVALATAGVAAPGTDGGPSVAQPRSLCVHGDTPGAAELARRMRDRLVAAGIRVEAFT
ncbi:LamB/YcsF family protein [Streptomyces sp. YIM 130001]|uniref:LamB/YcsF family protein n=1 Tax=Streptomyces sp. YIM 130001 TaxID=2259644 RepID=UPI000E64A309|nr:5-oxoprolinase subunit PxpA [Streptomyces sp. YIM 130001]RII14006.1 LamB/YcsF family protein [Streptomyces sp. YIM 130001]